MINSLEIQGENCSTKTSFDIIKIICICSFYVTEYIYTILEFPLQREVATYAFDDGSKVDYMLISLSYF